MDSRARRPSRTGTDSVLFSWAEGMSVTHEILLRPAPIGRDDIRDFLRFVTSAHAEKGGLNANNAVWRML